MEENIVSIINFKSDNGMTAVIKSSYNSVKLYVKDKDGNMVFKDSSGNIVDPKENDEVGDLLAKIQTNSSTIIN